MLGHIQQLRPQELLTPFLGMAALSTEATKVRCRCPLSLHGSLQKCRSFRGYTLLGTQASDRRRLGEKLILQLRNLRLQGRHRRCVKNADLGLTLLLANLR